MTNSAKTLQRRKRSAIYQNRERPKRSHTDIIFAEVLSKLLGFMNSELGNLSWVSHATIAASVGIAKEQLAAYIKATCLIGAVRLRYTNAATAHKRTLPFYPNYTEHAHGLTFIQLLRVEPDQPKRLNYYTLQGCMSWDGYSGTALPDWQRDVIKLCATKNGKDLHQAQTITARHRILGAPNADDEFGWLVLGVVVW